MGLAGIEAGTVLVVCSSFSPDPVNSAFVTDRLGILIDGSVSAEDEEAVEVCGEPAVVGDGQDGAGESGQALLQASALARSRLSVGSSSSSSVAPDSSSSRICSRACYPPDSVSNR